MILLIFLFFGAFFIISSNNLHLSDKTEAEKFVYEYSTWVSKLFENGASIAGYAVKSDWLPQT